VFARFRVRETKRSRKGCFILGSNNGTLFECCWRKALGKEGRFILELNDGTLFECCWRKALGKEG